ncbi:unnamed protein product [Phaeothamnion confervicola]
MRKAAIAVAVACLAQGDLARGDTWAVIVAGSSGWSNYRHQADSCHAYHILLNGGVSEDHIILMTYDDAASSRYNIYPGKLFNRPTPAGDGGWDVRKGCNASYVGGDVTKANFLAVLTGDQETTGGRPVLRSTAADRVFVYFADHGAPGLIAMPVGSPVYAQELLDALRTMRDTNMYEKLVFYLEACESGSMFEGLLPDDAAVYATTAANAAESSWGTYCGADSSVDGKELSTCLGDLYSVNWMEDSDLPSHMQSESLDAQFQMLVARTDLSHVMRYGDTSFSTERIHDFLGGNGRRRGAAAAAVAAGGAAAAATVDEECTDCATRLLPDRWPQPAPTRMAVIKTATEATAEGTAGTANGGWLTAMAELSSWNSRFVKLLTLRRMAARTDLDAALRWELAAEVAAEEAHIAETDATFALVARHAVEFSVAAAAAAAARTGVNPAEAPAAWLLRGPPGGRSSSGFTAAGARLAGAQLLSATASKLAAAAVAADETGSSDGAKLAQEAVAWVMFGTCLPLSEGMLGCHKAATEAAIEACGPFSDYSIRYARVFSNLCAAGVEEEGIVAAVRAACRKGEASPAETQTIAVA